MEKMKKSDKVLVIGMVSLVVILIVVIVISFSGVFGGLSLPEFTKPDSGQEVVRETVPLGDGEYSETFVYDDKSYDVTVYSADGKRIRSSFYNKKDVLIGEYTYFDDGKIKHLISYDDKGNPIGDYEYYPDGNSKKSITYIETDGVVTTYVTEYAENGDRICEYSYYDDGTKNSESTFVDGELVSRTYYNEDGNILLETVYTNGVEEYSYLYIYDEDGSFLSKMCYDADGNIIEDDKTEGGKNNG